MTVENLSYEIVKQIGSYETKDVTRESHLVKLTTPVICRGSKTFDLYETEYVIVEAMQIRDEEATYEETHIVASDEEGMIHDSVLYQAMRALTVPEALFSIGLNNTAQAEPEADVEETDTETETEEDN